MSARTRQATAAVVALLLVVVAVGYLRSGGDVRTGTAYFPKAIHVYKGSEVSVLGVRVGTVTGVRPEGTKVRVDFEYDAAQKVPADAYAVFVEPTLVADRALQLAPVYTGGPVLADHAVIPLARTNVPIELDDFNRNLSRLAAALGPRGANSEGAVSRAVTVGADNLRGEGGALHSTLTQVSALMTTLDSNKDALFETVRNLQAFSGALAGHDAETRSFTTNLAEVTAQLDSEKASFAAALHEVGISLEQVTRFVKDNRALVATDVGELSRVTTILANERVLLAHIADIGAVGVNNYPHMYTPSARTYNARFDNNDRQGNPALFVCQLYESVGGSPQQCLSYLKPLNALPIPPKAQR
jgi:phospholipid/cholesterol/gamma-HCH transport system substrate-binding protein